MATVLAYCQDTERRVTRIERALTRFWPGFWLVQDQLHEARTQIYDLEQHNVRLASLLVDESTNIQGRFVGIDYLADGGRVFGWPVRYSLYRIEDPYNSSLYYCGTEHPFHHRGPKAFLAQFVQHGVWDYRYRDCSDQ